MKYIFISGGVISGIGKGIASASIGLLLKSAGLKVAPIKFDPYLNVDAGTMNPVVHGEVFVLDDGVETDQDLGHYERFLNLSLDKHSIATQGSIYLSVIQRERQMGYGGECVDLVTGVTGEILQRIEQAGKAYDADVTIIEIGGTAGEYQNMLFLEANRLLKLRNPNDVIHVHITYLPIPPSIGEMKSKPAQMSVRDLHSCGIQPDVILARAEKPIDEFRRKKLSEATGVEWEDVISAPDVKNVYEIPLNFDQGGLTKRILHKLGFNGSRAADLKEWATFIDKQKKCDKKCDKKVRVAIVGKYFATGDYLLTDSYVSVIEALKHAGVHLDAKVELSWIDAAEVTKNLTVLENHQGIIVPGGFGARDVEGKLLAIKYARENDVPYLGLCYGMQLAIIERARNVLGLSDANSTEIDSATRNPVIHIMPDQEKKMMERDYGASMRLGAWDCVLTEGSHAETLYREFGQRKRLSPNLQISERHRHRYEFNNDYRDQINTSGLKIVGTSPDGKLVEVVEDAKNKFFIGTQFHPELTSRPLSPHPLFMGFVRAAGAIQ